MTSVNKLAYELSKLSLVNSTRSTRSPPRSTRSSPRSARSNNRKLPNNAIHIGSLPENVLRLINKGNYGPLYMILGHARFMRAMKGLRMTPNRFSKNGHLLPRRFYDPKHKTVYYLSVQNGILPFW